MKISVVICTYQRRHVLQRTLPTILTQDFPASDYEVIVVIDGSTDGTVAMLREQQSACRLRVLEQPNLGLGLARNAGLAVASGEYVLFLDDDILCPPDLLARHWRAHERAARPAVVFGPVLVAPESIPSAATWWTQAYTDEYVARLERGRSAQWPRDMVMEANYSAPRTVLLESGGNDPIFAVRRQSADWGLRLHRAGWPFLYEPEAPVRQLFVKLPDGVVKDGWWYGRSEVLLGRRHPSYRPHTIMARMNNGGVVMPVARHMAATLPLSPEPLLRPASWAATALAAWPPMKRAAVRLLELRQGIPMFRGAVAEAGSWGALQCEFGASLPVLLFHHVGPVVTGSSPGLTVRPRHFEAVVRWLAEHDYTSITATQWLAWLQRAEPLPPKPVLLTFDDALADLAEFAFPVLRRYGFGALVFVVTQEVGGSNRWADTGPGLLRCLTAAQLREWTGQGIEFGAHSRTHPFLPTLSPQELEEEVGGSRRELEDLLGGAVPTFAYPFGGVNSEVHACVRRHFALAFGTEEGPNTLATDPHLLRRTMLLPSDFTLDLRLRLRWGRSPLHALKARLRLRTRLRSALGMARS